MAHRLGGERDAVQNPLLRYAEEVGWTLLDPQEAERLRRGTGGLLLHEVFLQQAQRLNPGVVDLPQAEELAARLTRVRPGLEGNLEAWEYLNGLKTVFLPQEGREKNARLMDPADWKANTFHATAELRYTGGTDPIRLDAAFFVNGIPLLLVEAKSAHKLQGMAEALEQVRRYHREGAPLLTLEQLFTLTHLVQFYYGPTWNLGRKALLNWRDEAAGDFETLVKTFLHPARLVRVLADFVLFTRRDGELSKVVLRPHQIRAVERALGRAHDPHKQRALVWHTQGSGKTFTMIVLARKLLDEPLFESPTVLMLVDRNELEQQLFSNLASVGLAGAVLAESKRHLRELLQDDYRGLIVTTIHKFEGMAAGINPRRNIFVLVDEAHRTTGGDLGSYLMAALPGATLMGFTGTPIDRSSRGRSTFEIFGADDESGYLDKYSIRESIADETTVPLHYTLAPNELRVDRETLDREFLSLKEAEGVSDVEELNSVLERAVTLKNMLKNPQRVERVARFVAEHYQDYVKPLGFKAFLVGVDREACALYKEALDRLHREDPERYPPPEASAVVISPAHNDPPRLKAYHLGEDQERALRDAFRKEANPQILIVTEKLLTGYDAPVLLCMYLDKPMRDHVLLQAIARVNRPHQGKTSGLIVDFVGVFERLEKALAFDSQDVVEVVRDLGVLKEHFAQLMGVFRSRYLPLLDPSAPPDKAAEGVLMHFRDEEERQDLYEFYKSASDAFEVLSPDAFLRPYLDDYDLLSRMVRMLKEAYEGGVLVDREFLRKTAELVQSRTQAGDVGQALELYEINEELLDTLAKRKRPPAVEVFNLVRSIAAKVGAELGAKPFLVGIGERAEAVIQAFQQRQKDAQAALEELKALIAEINQAEAELAEKGLDARVFTVYWILQREGLPNAQAAAQAMQAVFEQHPHWQELSDQEREVRRALYRQLVEAGVAKERLVPLADQIVLALKGRRA